MDIFTLAAKLKLDSSGFSKDIKTQESVFKKFGGTAKKVVGGVAKFATMTAGAVGAAVIPVIKSATSAFANYEQLVGGVETLFKEASVFVKQDADKAFKEAGLSANEYMETATSFAASLIQGLGGDTLKAAEYANRAIIDMSDNANKMGTDIESIQNAYRGFSKQNFTMLDNLKLGYGGTKTEMERLLKDAEKLTGRKFDISNFADIVDAIHAIQVQMDITGTTAKEASTTITGSWNATKAAWQNLLVAMADPKGNVKKATKNFVDSGKTVLKNILPIINQSVSGIGEMLSEVAPLIGEALPEMVSDLAPKLLETGKNLIGGISKGIIKFASKIKWPKWKDVKVFASQAWDKIRDGVSNLGGLIFGKNKDGSVKWPTWKDVKSAAESAWSFIKTGVANLGGLIFGKNTDGTVKWPTWDDVKTAAESAWNLIKKGASELEGLVLGKNSTVDYAFSNALSFIRDIGDWIIEHWNEVSEGLLAILGALTVKKLIGLAAVNPLLTAIAAGALLVVTNWDLVKQKVEEVRQAIEDFKRGLEPINNWFLQLQGGGKGTFVQGQIVELQTDYRKVKAIQNARGDKAGQESFENFKNNFARELREAGISAEQAEEAVAKIDLSWTVEQMDEYIQSFSEASAAVQALKDDVEGVAGDYYINYHVNVDGPVNYPMNPKYRDKWKPKAKGDWNVPYDNFPALLHRNEMVLTASQARQYRDGNGGGSMSGLLSAIQGMRQDLQNLKFQVNGKDFGRAVIDYGSNGVQRRINNNNRMAQAGYGS